MESKKSIEESNDKNKEKDIDKDKEKQTGEKENQVDPKKAEQTEEQDDIFLDFLKYTFQKEQKFKDENSSKEKEKEKEKNIKNTKNFSLTEKDRDFLSSSIKKLQNGDDMDIISELILLCEQLSLSSDQIGDNPNMPKLLEEICINLEKLYIPEIIIYSLQCINYILDINPGLTSVLKRVGAIPKIIMLISAMEDTTCLESIVSVFEKISFENSFLLLENNVFASLLNVIDFLATPQRKSIMKTCQNISANSITYKQFDQYMKPALEPLCYLTKFSEDNSYINEKAIFIYYNIIYNLYQGFYFNNNIELENEISKYSFMDNFCEILKKYFIENNKKITADIIKKILKIIHIIFKVSKKETDKLLSLNFLEIVVEIIHHEFNDIIRTENNNNIISISNNINNINDINPAKSSSSFLTELFSLLLSLFPDIRDIKDNKDNKDNKDIKDNTDNTDNKDNKDNKDDKNKKNKDEKILRKENEKYYDYLSKNIIKPLVNNIMNKSACSTLNNLVKLILAFSKSASKEYIQNCINSKQMAQIISKLLDTKYEAYVYDLISLLEIFMTKTPEHFIKNFIREGIVENIKNYDFKPKQSTDIPKKKIKKKEKEKENKNKENKDKENDSFSDILDNENNDNNYNSDGYNDMDNENDNEDNQNEENSNDYNENGDQNDSANEEDIFRIDFLDKEKKDESKKDEVKKEEIKKDEKKEEIKKDELKKENKELDSKEKLKEDKNIKDEKNKDKDNKEQNNEEIPKDIDSKTLLEQEKILKDILEKTKKLKSQQFELMSQSKKLVLEERIKEFVDKYLTDEKIKSYLEKIKFTELINLKDTLIKLEKELKDACEKKR